VKNITRGRACEGGGRLPFSLLKRRLCKAKDVVKPELRQLRYFVAVAEEQHFGRAAERLGIAKPGLSQQIKRLERMAGTPLFVRDQRRVEMTAAGRALYEEARLTIEMAQRAIENARGAANGKVGAVKLGGYSLGYYPEARELVDEFRVRFPKVDVCFQPGHAAQSYAALIGRAIDVAIIPTPFDMQSHVRYHPLGRIEPLVAMNPGHRLAVLDRVPREELLAEPLFTWPRDLNPTLADHIRATYFGDNTHDHLIELADVTETLMRVASGEAIALISPSVTSLDISNVVFRRVAEPAPSFEYGLFWLEPPIARFVAQFVELASELGMRSSKTH
jgi:DNA-binding transcriptional LysR family regulator